MNLYGLRRSAKTCSPVFGAILAFSLIFFAADCKARDESAVGSAGVTAKASPAGNLPEGSSGRRYNLPSIIQYGLKNNPNLMISGKNIETEAFGVNTAWGEMMPKVDVGGGVTRFRYETPIAPVVLELPLGAGTEFPPFRRTIWDTALTFKVPLFRGGRLIRGVNVAEMRKAVARDNYRISRQDLIYNLSSVYYKIAQLEKLLLANDGSVTQLEAHKKNVELFLKAGTVPRLDLLKTDVDLAHTIENKLLVKNSLASSYELLKALMGMENMSGDISIISEVTASKPYPSLDESIERALSQRADYKAVAKKKLISEERVKIAQGKRLPDLFALGQYGGKTGSDTGFREDWYYGLRVTMPLLDGGLIRAEVNREKLELEKIKEEERALRLSITRDVRDAHLSIANALERIDVAERAMESGRESVRVERFKYDTGAGTSTDVIDAQTALLRVEADYYQAFFDKDASLAYLKKAIGEDEYEEEVRK